ncbi:MAG: LicD family protein [Anaeroplasmataceae bacterium]|nr:LicD family protein [Anaeroplasmataceae bacterium]
MEEIKDIREVQQISVNILKEIAEICEEKGFEYFLMYGTLIGAVRHNGFIPWDDDLDIMMPRPSYDALIEYLTKEYKGRLTLFTKDVNPKYPYMIARISDNDYVIKSEYVEDYGIGGFIDIYPLDGMGETLKECLKYEKKIKYLSSLCFLAGRRKLVKDCNPFRGLAKFFIWKWTRLLGKKHYFKKIDRIIATKDFTKSNYVGCPAWYSSEGKFFEKEKFEILIKHDFEGGQFFIPKEYDHILRKTYGDYMQLPPENERIGHHFYKLYKK